MTGAAHRRSVEQDGMGGGEGRGYRRGWRRPAGDTSWLEVGTTTTTKEEAQFDANSPVRIVLTEARLSGSS